MLSARALSISFTNNFLTWGLVFGALSLAGLALSYLHPYFGTTSTHMLVSAGLVTILVVFFLIKTAGGGVKRILRQLENGEWEGFTVVRAP